MEPGFVYILTNESFREDWIKIGKSARPVDIRSKELDNTAVPLPFSIFATLKTTKFHEVEKLVHKTIDRLTDLRIRQNREFFNIHPQVALDIFRDIATTLDDAVITLYKDNQPITNTSGISGTAVAPSAQGLETATPGRNRKRFKFSMVGIRPGDSVVFDPLNLTVKVATDDTVEYEGRLYKLSPFVGTFLPESMRSPSGAYQGPKYFSYRGVKLTVLRDEAEKRLG